VREPSVWLPSGDAVNTIKGVTWPRLARLSVQLERTIGGDLDGLVQAVSDRGNSRGIGDKSGVASEQTTNEVSDDLETGGPGGLPRGLPGRPAAQVDDEAGDVQTETQTDTNDEVPF